MQRYLAYFFVIVLMICGFSNFEAAGEEKPVPIGLLVPVTGSGAVLSEDLITAAQIAVDEANQACKLSGRSFKLIVEDTQTRPAPGMDAARKLIEIDKVPVITGGYSSGVSMPIAKYAQERGIVYLVAIPTSPLFRDVGDYIFSVTIPDTFKGKAMAEFAINDSGKKKYGLMFQNNAFGKMLMIETKKSLLELGAEIVSEVSYELDKVDYKAELQRLFANNPEAIIANFYPKEGFITLKQAYELGYLNVDKVPWYDPEIVSSTTKALEEIPKVLDGIKGIEPLVPEKFFTKMFKQKLGREPKISEVAQNYDAVRLITMAIMFANSTDPKDISSALYRVGDWYRGASYGGDKRFDKDGMQGHAQFRKVIIKNGKRIEYVGR